MAYMGVVTLPIALAPNQLRIAAAVEEHSIGRSLGWHQDLTVGAVARAVSDVSADAPGLAAMGSRARLLFDGYGAERVACEIAALATAKFVPAGEVA
jgi:spore coat polysaccharide biosynthesis predicted glycosyltransferase SpsG